MTLREFGLHLHDADRAAAVRRIAVGERIDLRPPACGRQQRVLAQSHRRRAGVRVLPGDDDVEPAQARARRSRRRWSCSCPRAPGPARCAPRSRRRPDARRLRRRRVADLLQCSPTVMPSMSFCCSVDSSVKGADEHARAHHHRHEARAFLVGPDRHFDRRLRLMPWSFSVRTTSRPAITP